MGGSGGCGGVGGNGGGVGVAGGTEGGVCRRFDACGGGSSVFWVVFICYVSSLFHFLNLFICWIYHFILCSSSHFCPLDTKQRKTLFALFERLFPEKKKKYEKINILR